MPGELPDMAANPCARLRVFTLAASSALTLIMALTGCNMEAHDSIDNHPSSAMPIPASAKATPQKPAVPPPPPPSEADMGMPIYPNATTYVDAVGNFIKPEPGSGMAQLQTPDSVDSVIAFYKSKIMQTDAQGKSTPSTPTEEKQDGKRKVTLVGNDAEGNTQMVEAREEDGKTAIELMSTRTKALPSNLPGANKAGDTPGAASTPPVPPASGKTP